MNYKLYATAKFHLNRFKEIWKFVKLLKFENTYSLTGLKNRSESFYSKSDDKKPITEAELMIDEYPILYNLFKIDKTVYITIIKFYVKRTPGYASSRLK